MDDLKNILESLLFVADEPLAIDRFKKILPEVETKQIRQAMTALAAQYIERGTSFYLEEVAGGYQLRTRPEYTKWIQRLVQPKPARLSRAALETLAIIAYKQPVVRADIEHIRGVDSGGVLRLLMERKLVRILGRKEIPGRPLIYATTKLFLEVFGLKDLKELPTPEEIESLGDEDAAPSTDGMDESEKELPAQKEGSPETNPSEGPSLTNTRIEQPPDEIEDEKPQELVHGDQSGVGQEKPSASETAVGESDPEEEKALDADTSEDYKNGQQSETGG